LNWLDRRKHVTKCTGILIMILLIVVNKTHRILSVSHSGNWPAPPTIERMNRNDRLLNKGCKQYITCVYLYLFLKRHLKRFSKSQATIKKFIVGIESGIDTFKIRLFDDAIVVIIPKREKHTTILGTFREIHIV